MDRQKLQILLDTQTELNYKDFCEYLEIPIKTGNSKIKQLKEIDSICKREMTSSTKFKIVEIYQEIFTLNKYDNRSKTLPNIEYILMSTLSKNEELNNGVLFASCKDLLRTCYMINDNYYNILNKKDTYSTYIGEKYNFDDSFIEYVNKGYGILKPSMESALNSMEKRKEICVTTGYKVKRNNKDNENNNCIYDYVSVTDELGCELFKIQGDAMRELGINNYTAFYSKGGTKLKKDYYDLCTKMIKYKSKNDQLWIENNWNYEKFTQCYAITLNVNKIKYDLETLNIAKKELNKLTNNKMHETKTLRNISYNNIDKWFMVCNTKEGDLKYTISEDLYKKFIQPKFVQE